MTQRQTRPQYTADRRVPGAFEGETITRRRFMTGVATATGAVAAAAFTLPALGFAVAPVFEPTSDTWQEVGPVARSRTPSAAVSGPVDAPAPAGSLLHAGT